MSSRQGTSCLLYIQYSTTPKSASSYTRTNTLGNWWGSQRSSMAVVVGQRWGSHWSSNNEKERTAGGDALVFCLVQLKRKVVAIGGGVESDCRHLWAPTRAPSYFKPINPICCWLIQHFSRPILICSILLDLFFFLSVDWLM